MTIQYDNLNSTISAVGTATNIPVNIQPKGTGGLNLLGSGQNLILRSQALTTSPWSLNNAPTTASTTDPLGGSTATQFTTSSAGSGVFQTLTGTSGVTYTWSIHIKYISGNGIIKIGNDLAPNTATVVFNSSAGTIISSGAGIITSGVVNIGNGWYRVSGTYVSTGSPMAVVIYSNNSDAMSWAAWGVQYEIGTSLNTYIPTTTTAIYGTPTLTFSGVAGLGLQSDGSLYVQPAGTGAIQAAPTTSTAVGGNARGINAVDWQTARGVAGQVSSGAFSSIGGGFGNSAFSFAGSVVGGYGNGNAGGFSFIGGGNANAINSGTILVYTAIVGGNSNTANGFYNFIGGGFTNSGTSITAVTTQSATMNATTAVTLSGSNANIKVGQYISGTSIGSDTYVAAISGTSLTLSKVATGSSTSTLSFYTPHGVVVGGGNNQATGSYSFIGGGGDAGTAANRNTASGAWSTVAGGRQNTASGIGSFIGGGGTDGTFIGGNTASSSFSTVAGGFSNGASGFGSFIGGGQGNSANGTNSVLTGGAFGTTRLITGNQTSPACNQPIASAQGVSQSSLLVLGIQTTDATATILRSDPSAAGTTNQVILPNNSAYFFRGEVVSGVTGGGNTKGWTIEGVIKRGANAASTTLVGTPTVTSSFADAGASTWDIAVTADTTNGGLRVTFTGQAATTIRTVAQIRTTEMTF
jgi:hypothetical protein